MISSVKRKLNVKLTTGATGCDPKCEASARGFRIGIRDPEWEIKGWPAIEQFAFHPNHRRFRTHTQT
jgi:hypothetical protein